MFAWSNMKNVDNCMWILSLLLNLVYHSKPVLIHAWYIFYKKNSAEHEWQTMPWFGCCTHVSVVSVIDDNKKGACRFVIYNKMIDFVEDTYTRFEDCFRMSIVITMTYEHCNYDYLLHVVLFSI